jgi:hypothetical protein
MMAGIFAFLLPAMAEKLGCSNSSDDAFGQVSTVVWAYITAVPGILLLVDEDNIIIAVCVSVMPAIAAIFTFVVVALVAAPTAVDLFDPALVVVVLLPARFATCNLSIFGDCRALD